MIILNEEQLESVVGGLLTVTITSSSGKVTTVENVFIAGVFLQHRGLRIYFPGTDKTALIGAIADVPDAIRKIITDSIGSTGSYDNSGNSYSNPSGATSSTFTEP